MRNADKAQRPIIKDRLPPIDLVGDEEAKNEPDGVKPER
jgi:hypothetical protein